MQRTLHRKSPAVHLTAVPVISPSTRSFMLLGRRTASIREDGMATAAQTSVDQLSINTIRTLAIDAVQKANSGHPGAPMALAPAAYTLWQQFLRHNPSDPHWPNRDRFVLSNGHASMLLYSLLHLTGYDLTLDELKHFRQWGSKTPGHPEFGMTPGVETTTGPLGQGCANSVGMAIAQRWMAAHFNKDRKSTRLNSSHANISYAVF